jgi:hypothetical protein
MIKRYNERTEAILDKAKNDQQEDRLELYHKEILLDDLKTKDPTFVPLDIRILVIFSKIHIKPRHDQSISNFET